MTYTNELSLHLLRTNTAHKKMTTCKKDDGPLCQKTRFFIPSKEMGLSLDI